MTPSLYRGPVRIGAYVDDFTTSFLRAMVVQTDGAHYDATYTAFIESGLEPRITLHCAEVHADTRLQGLNAMADALVAAMTRDHAVQTALRMAFHSVLRRFTLPPPLTHLAPAEIRAFVDCCDDSDDRLHIDYDDYAARHAHLGVCARCEALLRLTVAQRSAIPMSGCLA